MTSLHEIRSSNTSLKTSLQNESLTALFTGATSGIGLATLQSFAKHTPNPTAVIIGRSQSRFEPELQNLKRINSRGTYTFVETDITLLRNIDALIPAIQSALAGKKIDLLGMSQGYLPLKGREDTIEGLDQSTSLRYYTRLRLIQNLLSQSLLEKNARILNILAGGWEGKVFEDDLDLSAPNFSLSNEMNHFTTLTTLSLDALAAENKSLRVLHVYPGVVATNLMSKNSSGLLGWVFRWILEPLNKAFYAMPAEECGERMFCYAMREEDGEEGRCVVLSEKGEVKENEVLKKYREKGFAGTVVEHNERMFEKALSK